MLRPAGGVAALPALLLAVIGLAGPMGTSTAPSMDYGIRDLTEYTDGGEKKLNFWDYGCKPGIPSASTCEAALLTSQFGFAFCIMGMLASLVFLAACFTQMVSLGAWIVGVVMLSSI